MTVQIRAVAVEQLPEKLSVRQGRTFLREMVRCMNVDRPRLVLDCSNVRQMDRPLIQVLLCCLEEAMKRNGDVRLAAIPPGAGAILESTGANRLFDIFDTAAEAVSSFRPVAMDTVPKTFMAERSQQRSESAA
jgi:anti-anti-sigma regulatory factor